MFTRHAALLALVVPLAPLTQAFATAAGHDPAPLETPAHARVTLVGNDAVLALPDGTRVRWRPETSSAKSGDPWGSPFHCPAEASCPGPSLEPAPQEATTTDDALGSYLYLGSAGTIIARFVDPNGSSRHNNVFSWNLAPCPNGTYNLTPLFSGYT